MAENTLYFGDNLKILRDNIRDETVDLIYLDPPFNSKANYNVLFRSPKGHESHAQITAFEDTWHWGEQAEAEFTELIHQENTDVAEMMNALRHFLGENDMMAYLTMMANRLLELHRVLKPAGSLYLHCDPTASHYLKMVLDSVFGKLTFRNEISWKRHNARSTDQRWPRIHDIIFFYSKSAEFIFHTLQVPADKAKLPHTLITGADGQKYQTYELTGAGVTRDGESGRPWRGYDPTELGRHWANAHSLMDEWDSAGLIHWPKKSNKNKGWPRRLDDEPFVEEDRLITVGDVWADIDRLNQTAKERLGYPTQKPVALLERIIKASSNECDVVLDPFCGCGTAIHAAEKLKRKWIGIDITHLAISLVEKRLKDAFPGIKFEVHGTPKDFESAADLAKRDKYQFQWWACSLVNAQPYQGKKKGADTGIDGLIYFQDDQSGIDKARSLPRKVVVSVKAGENIGVAMIRDFAHVIDREKAALGLFITLAEPTRAMKEEAASFGFYESLGTTMFPKLQILTIKGLLDGTKTARYPDLTRGGLTFKKAKKEVSAEQLELEVNQ